MCNQKLTQHLKNDLKNEQLIQIENLPYMVRNLLTKMKNKYLLFFLSLLQIRMQNHLPIFVNLFISILIIFKLLIIDEIIIRYKDLFYLLLLLLLFINIIIIIIFIFILILIVYLIY